MASVIHVFGLDSPTRDYSKIFSALENSVAVVAGKHLYKEISGQLKDGILPQLIPVVPLTNCIASIREYLDVGNVVVLASGDPLFYGIGRRLIRSFPGHRICVHPAVSSMQLAFARFNLPWDDAEFVSLHGRSNEHLASRLLKYPKVFLLTDPVSSPNVIAGKLLAECEEDVTAGVTCYVGECLGFPEERLFSGSLAEIAKETFAAPNVMILLNPTTCLQSKKIPAFGLQEKEICHSRGLVTKNEVRAAAIHALRFPQDGIFWDVGAGSGSVGLEAARLFPGLHVLSIEKEVEQWQNIELNKKKFRVCNMNLVKGEAPDALQQLPVPARVFIGGSGGALQHILEFCAERLVAGGIIVVNAVIDRTAKLAPEILYRLGFDVEIREIAVQRFSYPEKEKQHFNPIKIIVGNKPIQESGDEQ